MTPFPFLFKEDDAYFNSEKLDVAITPNFVLQKNNNSYLLKGVFKSKQGPNIQYSLEITPTRLPILMGKTGLVDMWENTNSYYYSYAHMTTSGSIQIDGEEMKIDPQLSLSWMDHQWGDFLLIPPKEWIWSSIQLDNGVDINLGWIMNGQSEHSIMPATIIMQDGATVNTTNIKVIPHLKPGEKYPLSYEIGFPSIGLQLTTQSLVPNQDTNGFWEGISEAQGIYNSKEVKGFAFMENTMKPLN